MIIIANKIRLLIRDKDNNMVKMEINRNLWLYNDYEIDFDGVREFVKKIDEYTNFQIKHFLNDLDIVGGIDVARIYVRLFRESTDKNKRALIASSMKEEYIEIIFNSIALIVAKKLKPYAIQDFDPNFIDFETRSILLTKLKKPLPHYIELLIDRLINEDTSMDVINTAAKQLGKIGKESVDAILALLFARKYRDKIGDPDNPRNLSTAVFSKVLETDIGLENIRNILTNDILENEHNRDRIIEALKVNKYHGLKIAVDVILYFFINRFQNNIYSNFQTMIFIHF
jgi:hypothetical protein